MLFNSYEFILAFLPITLIGYFLMNHFGKNNFAKVWLVLCSLFFYGYFNFSYLWIIVTSIVVNYLISFYFEKHKKTKKSLRKLLLGFGLTLNIGLLFFYKYLDFLFDTFSNIFNTDPIHLGLILPLGISFFTFQQVSFLIDSYRSQTKTYNILDYSLFVTFFPQLIAGPIVLHSEVIPQFENQRNLKFNMENFARGLYVFSRGLAKKVLVADNFGKVVSFGYANISGLSSFEAILTIFAYTFQIYFDFSGYCDMASGIAYMFNIELPINFNSPYKAKNISDFWKRWHITLTRFLTHYIYFPLGGSRCSTVRTCFNVLVVFLVSGIWHGAGYTFILWGIAHGVAMIIYRLFRKYIDKTPYLITWFFTFLFVNIAWVYFRAESIEDANQLIAQVFNGGFTLNFEITETLLNIIPISIFTNIFNFNSTLNILMILIVLGTTIICLSTRNVQEKAKTFRPKLSNLMSSSFLLVWSILSLSGVSTFLYFNF